MLRQYIVKVHSRCNLRCDYCYVYAKNDSRWTTRPPVMATATVDLLARRLAEHVNGESSSPIDVILHGGEPLLIGRTRLRHLVQTLRSAVGTLNFSVQTNGSLLSAAMLDELDELGVGVGVSLDGDAAAHDRHRRTGGGHGSHRLAEAGLERLTAERHRHLFRGLLCTIDLANEPVATYEALLRFAPPAVDFLLPHANWDQPPDLPAGRAVLSHGDWLIAAFDRWYDAPRQETSVRMFESVIDGLFGRPSSVHGLGTVAPSLVVVETDGAMEWNDSLASAYHGAASTGLDLERHRFAEFEALPDVSGPPPGSRVPTPCRSCRVQRVCGGGLPAHRYAADGFDRRSVYCADLLAFIRHVQTRLRHDLGALTRAG
ncbi:FxsB family radical SAM/SPASM domain protein [Kineosporia mesophila]|uniref:FxsB family radical SAM/SPASM domain protein n=1 Tax=Kineosporia mesophila TaxID=566012 RepID=A0ABP6Z479_9ACTN|nr:FxsB family cyclophane-forming radical SAM/SPASM peptide maturase [Kineosporia mesophila]MCD5352602.1 FxsB family radical SAM/SPASM domain protein [Kineosporia mesophila]